MEEKAALSKVVMYITRNCLVVPIQAELYDETVLQMQKDILERVKETGIKGVIIDVSGVDIIDFFLGRAISDTARMVSLLGATTVLTGLKPGVVASLVDLDLELGDIQTAITLEEGFRKLQPQITPRVSADGADEEAGEEIEEVEEEAVEEEGVEAEEEAEDVDDGTIEDDEDEEELEDEEFEDER